MPSNDVTGKRFENSPREEIAPGGGTDQREVILNALRAEIRKGADSGASIPAAQVFAEVRAALAAGSAAV